MKFSMLAAMDGNSSLKLIDNTFLSGSSRTDDRASTSSRWLMPEEVSQFKDKVSQAKSRRKVSTCYVVIFFLSMVTFFKVSATKGPNNYNSQSPTRSTIPVIGSSTQLEGPNTLSPPSLNPDTGDDNIAWLNIAENDEAQKIIDVCMQRWRSAAPEARKKMFAMFAISRIFIAVCRHGHLLAICDMIHSSELLSICVTPDQSFY
jgi:hypothetical protein